MKYLCLTYGDEAAWTDASQREIDAIRRDCLAADEELRRSGHLIAMEASQPLARSATVRFRNGEISIGDGPSSQIGEPVTGFYLIDARDLNEAIQVVSRSAAARLGRGIEVRPIEVI